MPEYRKPLPAIDPDSRPFWEGCARHELRAQRCSTCGSFRWPPQRVCPECYSWEAEWVPLAGTGSVTTFVVVHYVSVPAFEEDVPYVVAHIGMDGTDGRVQVLSNVIGCPWEEVRVGMPVRVVFEDVTPEVTLPKFRPL